MLFEGGKKVRTFGYSRNDQDLRQIEEKLILEDEKYKEVTFNCPPKFYLNVKFIMGEAERIKDDIERINL